MNRNTKEFIIKGEHWKDFSSRESWSNILNTVQSIRNIVYNIVEDNDEDVSKIIISFPPSDGGSIFCIHNIIKDIITMNEYCKSVGIEFSIKFNDSQCSSAGLLVIYCRLYGIKIEKGIHECSIFIHFCYNDSYLNAMTYRSKLKTKIRKLLRLEKDRYNTEFHNTCAESVYLDNIFILLLLFMFDNKLLVRRNINMDKLIKDMFNGEWVTYGRIEVAEQRNSDKVLDDFKSLLEADDFRDKVYELFHEYVPDPVSSLRSLKNMYKKNGFNF